MRRENVVDAGWCKWGGVGSSVSEWGTDEQLRNSFNFKLFSIKLASACRMYGVLLPTEREGYRAHNALWDAEVAGRLYFAMRGIAYRE